MVPEQFVEAGQFGNDVFSGAPGEATAGMDVNALRSEPLNAASKTESARVAGKSAELVAQQAPGAAFFGEALVVVRFAVMNESADGFAFGVTVVQISSDLRATVILEQFRIGPLHAAFGEQSFGGVPWAAQAFEQKERVWKFVAHAGGNIFPGHRRNFITG